MTTERLDASSCTTVTVGRGGEIPGVKVAGEHTPVADWAAVSRWDSMALTTMEQEAVTMTLTVKLLELLAARADARSTHTINTTVAARKIRIGIPIALLS